jgi:hypothetical protein
MLLSKFTPKYDNVMNTIKFSFKILAVTGGVISFIILLYKLLPPYSKQSITHFQLNEMMINKIIKYQPFVEGCAGNGFNAQKLRERGTDIISFDIEPDSEIPYDIPTDNKLIEHRVQCGAAGTFEHLHSDRTLLILCGYSVEKSIVNYHGDTIIIGGYYFPESREGYNNKMLYRLGYDRWQHFEYNNYLLPKPDWIEENGWSCIETIVTDNCIQSGQSGQSGQNYQYARDFIVRIYKRSRIIDINTDTDTDTNIKIKAQL